MTTKLQQFLKDAEDSGDYYVAPGKFQNHILEPGVTHAIMFGNTERYGVAIYQNRALQVDVLLALEPQNPDTPDVYVGTILPFNKPVTVNELAASLRAEAAVVSKASVEASWFKTFLLKAHYTPSGFISEGFSTKRHVVDGILPVNHWVYLNIFFGGVQPLTHVEVTRRLEDEGFEVLNPLYGLTGLTTPRDEWSIGDNGIIVMFKTDKLIKASALEKLPAFKDLTQIGGQVRMVAQTSPLLDNMQGFVDAVYWTKSGEAVVGGVASTIGEAAGSAATALDMTSDALGSFNSALKSLRKHGTLVMVGIGVLAAAAGGYWLYKRNKKSKKSKKKGG